MIEKITGVLETIEDGHALVSASGITYGVLVSPHTASELVRAGRKGSQITFYTIYYIEGSPGMGNLFPRLVGFAEKHDLEFFLKLTAVQGFGMRKALRSLVIPSRDMARAIEMNDTAALKKLPEIGAKTAQKIIVELKGKMLEFTQLEEHEIADGGGALPKLEDENQQDALDVLLQLQYAEDEAVRLIKKAAKAHPDISTPDELIQEVFRMQGGPK